MGRVTLSLCSKKEIEKYHLISGGSEDVKICYLILKIEKFFSFPEVYIYMQKGLHIWPGTRGYTHASQGQSPSNEIAFFSFSLFCDIFFSLLTYLIML